MSTPAVTVLLPCYNVASTLEILQSWQHRDARSRVLARPHAGIISALNAGLAECQAPFVARLDADIRAEIEWRKTFNAE